MGCKSGDWAQIFFFFFFRDRFFIQVSQFSSKVRRFDHLKLFILHPTPQNLAFSTKLAFQTRLLLFQHFPTFSPFITYLLNYASIQFPSVPCFYSSNLQVTLSLRVFKEVLRVFLLLYEVLAYFYQFISIFGYFLFFPELNWLKLVNRVAW